MEEEGKGGKVFGCKEVYCATTRSTPGGSADLGGMYCTCLFCFPLSISIPAQLKSLTCDRLRSAGILGGVVFKVFSYPCSRNPLLDRYYADTLAIQHQ